MNLSCFFSTITITPLLEKDIENFSILVKGPPQIMLPSMNLHEFYTNLESISETSMFGLNPCPIWWQNLLPHSLIAS